MDPFCHITLIRSSHLEVFLGGDYMIPACRVEISTRPAETDFTLQLHVEIKLRPGKAGLYLYFSLDFIL